MKIAIATSQVPFITGGAEMMTAELTRSLRDLGHSVETISIPFRFNSHAEILRTMNSWSAESFDTFDCGHIDRVICLKFPCYYLTHHNKVAWLMHQHRSVYELYDTVYGESSCNASAVSLRSEIVARDTKVLGDMQQVFTISKRVSARMKQYNGIETSAIYQPPKIANLLYEGEQLPYIFFPSRIETLKRQELLVRAMKLLTSPCVAVIAGDGGQFPYIHRLVEELDLSHKVRLLGSISDSAMARWYANALGVFFGPFDEDYGFVTLEAMLASKPVITCSDSGGPLEFVRNNETGLVVEPLPEQIADAIDQLFSNRSRAKSMGKAGFHAYHGLDISWENICNTLLTPGLEVPAS